MIAYRRNTSTARDVTDHLLACDGDFIPPLSQRVQLEDYAQKLVRRAERFEAWIDEELVGLIAAYCNASDNQTAFITSVSVLPARRGAAIGQQLLEDCLDHAAILGFRRIELQVAAANSPALRLYARYGFQRRDGGGAGDITLWRDLAPLMPTDL